MAHASLQRSSSNSRAITAVLVLTAHALFVLLLLIERAVAPRQLAAPPQLVGVTIRLLPFNPLPPAAPGAQRPEQRVLRPRTDTRSPRAIDVLTAPASPKQGAEREAASDPELVRQQSRPTDWYAAGAALAARHGAQDADKSSTFSPPPTVMRAPCPPRSYMDETGNRRRNGSSFKWRWDDTSKGGSGMLTPGWEPAPIYDGIFDDMKAGKTPDSSVPGVTLCD